MDELIVFSVFEITQHLKQVIETQIDPLYIRGELSNFVRHSSGHIYFNLKDDNATLRCTFFRFANLKLDFQPEDGMEVVCFGKLSIYEKGGTYNLNVQSMSLSGKGDLAQRFELLKNKLREEGLFDSEHKQALPRYPQRIGVITSPTGAAFQDIKNVLSRRFPVRVDLYPAQVQGADAPAQLIAGLQYFNAAQNVDVIIITRGGGSQEDLFCFNDEALAREIFASRIPVISAVGHEIDFTIADFVADLRAPTPSVAAELVVPNRIDVQAYLASLAVRLGMVLSAKTDSSKSRYKDMQMLLLSLNPEKTWQNLQQRLDMAALSLMRSGSELQTALHRLDMRKTMAQNTLQNSFVLYHIKSMQHVKELQTSLGYSIKSIMIEKKTELEKLGQHLNDISPHAILNKGYSVLMRGRSVVSSVKNIQPKDRLKLVMKDGTAGVIIEQISPQDSPDETD